MPSLLGKRSVQGHSVLSHSGFNGLTVIREHWKSTACLGRKWWDLYTLLFSLYSGWLRRAGGTAQMCIFLFLLSPFLWQHRCLSTSFIDQPFCSVLFSAGLVSLLRFSFFFSLLNVVSPAKLPSAPLLFILLGTERDEKEWILEEKSKPAISYILNYPVACWLGTRRLACWYIQLKIGFAMYGGVKWKPFTISLTDCYCVVPFMNTPLIIGTAIKMFFGWQTAQVSSREIKAGKQVKRLAMFLSLTHG